MKQISSVLLFSLFVLFAAGCRNDSAEQLAEARHAAQVETLMQQLSIREKVAQLFVMEISREPSE